jgi:hypothetical protein
MTMIAIDATGAALGPEALATLAEADVIIGVEAGGQREFTVFGTPSLEDSGSLKKPAALRTVRVLLRNEADLAELLEHVRRIQGLKTSRSPR